MTDADADAGKSDKKVPVDEFWDKKAAGSAQNEVDKTFTLSNSFSNSFSHAGFQEEDIDDHLLRHAHR